MLPLPTTLRPALLLLFLSLFLRGPRVAHAQDSAAVPALDGKSFDRWLTYVSPSGEESRFHRVPWRAALWEAAVEARRAGKPVLLWAMNGHPLGLT